MAAYHAASGAELDVRELTALARCGDATARGVIDHALAALGDAVAPWLSHFETVVMGGSMTGSWDVIGPPFLAALGARSVTPNLLFAGDVEASALIGAAYHASGSL
jgi:glucokinase